jgi:hypothetical protein
VPFIKLYNKQIRVMGIPVTIKLGERQTVGDYSVELLDVDGKKAKIRICNTFKAWEDIMIDHIQTRYGSIDVCDMIYWSRLHSDDVSGIISMCGNTKYESSAVLKIPKKNYEILSSGWFAANKPCTSIYVPFHICNEEIYRPYESGDAAEMSLELFNTYGHDVLNNYFTRTEEVLIAENEQAEDFAQDLIKENGNVSDFLTIIDTNMQKQAYTTQQLWLEAGKIPDNDMKQRITDFIEDIWYLNYTCSIDRIKTILPNIKNISESDYFSDKIEDIALNICTLKFDAARSIGIQNPEVEKDYTAGKKFIKQGDYVQGFELIEKSIKDIDLLMKGESLDESKDEEIKIENTSVLLFALVFVIILVIVAILLKKKQS